MEARTLVTPCYGNLTGNVVLMGSVHPPAFLPGPGVAKTEFTGHGGTKTTFK